MLGLTQEQIINIGVIGSLASILSFGIYFFREIILLWFYSSVEYIKQCFLAPQLTSEIFSMTTTKYVDYKRELQLFFNTLAFKEMPSGFNKDLYRLTYEVFLNAIQNNNSKTIAIIVKSEEVSFIIDGQSYNPFNLFYESNPSGGAKTFIDFYKDYFDFFHIKYINNYIHPGNNKISLI